MIENKETILSMLKKIFEKTIDCIFAVILFFITLTLLIGCFRLFFRLAELLKYEGVTGGYLFVFSDIMTLFILLELSRSLIDYFSEHRLQLIFIIDAGIVFVLRDIMIALFEHKLESSQIYALSALLLALGVIRIGSILVFQKEKRISQPQPK